MVFIMHHTRSNIYLVNLFFSKKNRPFLLSHPGRVALPGATGSSSWSGRLAPEHEWWLRSPAWSRPLSDSGGRRGCSSGSSSSSSPSASMKRNSDAVPVGDVGAKKPPFKSTRAPSVPSLFDYVMN